MEIFDCVTKTAKRKIVLYRVIRPLRSETVSATQTKTREFKLREVLPFFAIAETLLLTEGLGRASTTLEDSPSGGNELVEAETTPCGRG